MLFYRQFRKKLAQTAKKLKQQLIDVIYKAVIHVFTPPLTQTRKQTKNIFRSAGIYSKAVCMVRLFEKSLPCN